MLKTICEVEFMPGVLGIEKHKMLVAIENLGYKTVVNTQYSDETNFYIIKDIEEGTK